MVLEKIVDFFKMDVKATRFNWYRDSNDWKPYHHDAAAVKPDKGISLEPRSNWNIIRFLDSFEVLLKL